jgi:hypothetical protein
MAYFLGRDVSVVLKAGDDVGVTAAGALAYDDSGVQFADTTGVTVSDVTGVDLGIGVTDEDITYMGSKTVLKAEIKKETTVSLTRKKKDNVWDVVFNGLCRWGAASNAPISSLVQPTTISDSGGTATTYGYQILITLKASEEVFKVPNAVITGHSVSLNADGTTEETLEFVSYEDPVIATS